MPGESMLAVGSTSIGVKLAGYSCLLHIRYFETVLLSFWGAWAAERCDAIIGLWFT